MKKKYLSTDYYSFYTIAGEVRCAWCRKAVAEIGEENFTMHIGEHDDEKGGEQHAKHQSRAL